MWIKVSTFLCSYFCVYFLMFVFGPLHLLVSWPSCCRYWCKKCKKRFSSQIKLVDHMSSPEHNNPKTARWKILGYFFLLLLLSFCWPFSFGAGPIQEQAHRPVLIKAAPPQLPLCSRTRLQLESCFQWFVDLITRLFSFSALLLLWS